MKQVRYGVAFIAAISAFTVGCVSTRTTQVDSRTSAWRGKSVALTNRPPAGFAPVTAGKMMFGLIGAAAMVEAGRTNWDRVLRRRAIRIQPHAQIVTAR